MSKENIDEEKFQKCVMESAKFSGPNGYWWGWKYPNRCANFWKTTDDAGFKLLADEKTRDAAIDEIVSETVEIINKFKEAAEKENL